MYQQETITPYSQGSKAQQVEQMFDNIAPTYDTLNHRLSWNIDKGWRRKAISQLKPFAPKSLLDVATGTGDFAILSAQMLRPETLIGADISEGMMEIGRQKVKQLGLDRVVRFEKEDCLHLSYEDNTFDAVTAAFGIRNFVHLEKGLTEMVRVLKPGGRMAILELSTPDNPMLRPFYNLYTRCIIPLLGEKIAKNREAYTYLPESIERFPKGKQMRKMLEKTGCKVRQRKIFFGVCRMYKCTKKQ